MRHVLGPQAVAGGQVFGLDQQGGVGERRASRDAAASVLFPGAALLRRGRGHEPAEVPAVFCTDRVPRVFEAMKNEHKKIEPREDIHASCVFFLFFFFGRRRSTCLRMCTTSECWRHNDLLLYRSTRRLFADFVLAPARLTMLMPGLASRAASRSMIRTLLQRDW